MSSEEEMIESVAKKIHEKELGSIARFLLEGLSPLSFIGGELAIFFLAPYLPLLDDKGYNFIDILEKRENLKKLSLKLKTLEEKKAMEEAEKRELKNDENANDIHSKIESLKCKIGKFIKRIKGR